jgi:RNA polymerase sigma-70 factor (ECF subfamily)
LERELYETFVAALPPAAQRGLDRDDVSRGLQSIVWEATERWGDLGLSPARFAGFLATCCVEEGDPLNALEGLHTVDLYLARACCEGSDEAVALLEQTFIVRLPAALARLSLSPAKVQEVLQEVRRQLFVPNQSAGTSALERYLGRAPLSGWLRAVTLRTAMRLLRAGARELPVDDRFLEDQLAATDDPELVFLREAYRPAFRAAFRSGLASLTTRQRNLLRQHHLDGLTVTHLAVMYGAHRVTVSRWISEARRELAQAVEVELTATLGMRRSECASVVRLCISRPDLTFSSFFCDDDPPT